MYRLLLVAQNETDFEEHMIHLRTEGFDFGYERNNEKIEARIEREGFSGVVFVYKKDWQNCIEICTRIKERKNILMILVSGCNCEKEALYASRRGILYFPKGSTPFYISSIIKMCFMGQTKLGERYVAKAHSPEEKPAYDVELKESTKEFFIGGKSVKCAGKVYELWKYLLGKGESFTSDEEIYRDVWETDILQGYKNTVRVHIKKIRDCIPENMKHICFIENARGKGYRFIGSYRCIKSFFFI